MKFSKLVAWIENQKEFFAKLTYALIVIAYAVGALIPPLADIVLKPLGFSWTVDGNSILIGAVIAHFGFLMALVLDVHSKTTAQERWYPTHQEALSDIRQSLVKATARPNCELTWIGVSLQSAWLALEDVLQRMERGDSRIDITLFQSDPAFLRGVSGSMEGLIQITEAQMNYMRRRLAAMEPALRRSGSKVGLHQYAYMPNYHGVLINGEELFLSNVRWQGADASDLSVPREPFERLDRSTPRGVYMIELFLSWRRKALVYAEEAGTSHEFPAVAMAPVQLAPSPARVRKPKADRPPAK
jgi:hypothetical protein